MASGSPRVLVVADHLGYPGGVVHGVTTYFLEVLPALVRAGVDLTVCYLREPHPAAESLRAQGIEPIFLSAARVNPFVGLRVVAMARQTGATVLHAMGIKATLMARLATRMVPARTILHLHDLLEPGPVVGRLQRTFARPTDMAICVARAAVPIAVECYNVRPERVRVIHNGIRLELYHRVQMDARVRLRGELGVDEQTRVLLLVGRMHPIKGHRTMLRMLPGIVRRCPDAVLWLAGDGPERPACEALVGDLGLQQRVRFLGQRRDVPELLAASDLVVVPSQLEGLPIAAIEAHAAGRPVVGFGVGGVGEVVQDGISGHVVGAADEAAFIAAAAALLMDDRGRAEFGTAARRLAERFSLDEHVRQLIRCYQDIAVTRDARTARIVNGSKEKT